MSMEISSNYKDYKNEYLDRVQTGQDKVKEASQDQRGEDKNEGIPVPKDEYISSEKSGSKPSGLYRLGQDENGNPSTRGRGKSEYNSNCLCMGGGYGYSVSAKL